MSLVIGHKGAAALADENRVPAFRTARAVGADGVELDVRRAADGRLAVWHDPDLPDGRVLRDTPWPRLRDDVDELPAVLDASVGLRLVNVEIKNWPGDADHDPDLGIARAVVDLLAGRPADEQASFLVSCFDPATLDATRTRLDEIAPSIATGVLLWLVHDIAEVVEKAVEGGHAALHPHHSAVTPELVDAARSAGLTINCWTCNDPDRIRWLAEIGTDGIITDDPKLALEALGRTP